MYDEFKGWKHYDDVIYKYYDHYYLKYLVIWNYIILVIWRKQDFIYCSVQLLEYGKIAFTISISMIIRLDYHIHSNHKIFYDCIYFEIFFKMLKVKYINILRFIMMLQNHIILSHSSFSLIWIGCHYSTWYIHYLVNKWMDESSNMMSRQCTIRFTISGWHIWYRT